MPVHQRQPVLRGLTSQVLSDDRELAAVIPQSRRAEAVRRCSAAGLVVWPGPWNRAPLFRMTQGLGALVLRGLVARSITVADRRGVELLGPGDLIALPEGGDDLALLALDETWDVLDPLRVALLDARFVEQALAGYPELIGALLARVERQTNRVAINLAIVHHQRVDVRILCLLWDLAGRWGRPQGTGMLVPFGLRHTMLADLVAARRQAVTTALGSLGSRGLVTRTPEGWLLHREEWHDLRDRGVLHTRHEGQHTHPSRGRRRSSAVPRRIDTADQGAA